MDYFIFTLSTTSLTSFPDDPTYMMCLGLFRVQLLRGTFPDLLLGKWFHYSLHDDFRRNSSHCRQEPSGPVIF